MWKWGNTMNCSICNSENVKYKNSKKSFAIGKILCRKCYNNLYKQTEEYIKWKVNYDSKRYINNKEQIKERVKIYYSNNRLSIIEKNREYYNKNKSKFRLYSSIYKLKKINASPKWLTKDHKDQINLIYNKCRTLNKTSDIQYQVDHIIPIRGKLVSGLHVPWNLQILTSKENRSKSNNIV